MLQYFNYRVKLNSVFGTDRSRYGDLYGLSYLPDFKKDDPLDTAAYPDTVRGVKRDINLYVLCNSYIYAFVKTEAIFAGVKRYWFGRPGLFDDPVVKFDSTERNVLLLQSTEHFLHNLTIPGLLTGSLVTTPSKSKVDTLPSEFEKKVNVAKLPVNNMLFNPRIHETLEFNLFDYRFLTPLKELKAQITYKWFNRTDHAVRISSDKKYLFMASSVDTSNNSSSFKKVTDQEINEYVMLLNQAYDHYKSLGFDEVYLSIIPSAVTILAPNMGEYNNIIPRIQNHPDLKMPYIDIYKKFRYSKESIYQTSDMHWNYNGFRIWVNEFNKTLQNTYKNDKFKK
ncbi:hypothetical protein EOD41_00035 [Mucilaginibacter limnophilus]|uniref:AlgX/AlgJ SGNH hydrolase-like domain-containing protein n=1 Tax=Mucilaginibacter limnophilus TaxID=1932778 RepID=A0A437MXM9_9SPHI|nr:hypothetical protein [Mucilaginibacter limnophilus]RVU02366.1 hypothetical protein EOD41_00035 [Mucilaginibacter limnophilus]